MSFHRASLCAPHFGTPLQWIWLGAIYLWNWTGISAIDISCGLSSCFWIHDRFMSLSSLSRGSWSNYLCKRRRPRQYAGYLFLHSKQCTSNFSYFNKCFLVASYFLGHCHSVHNSCPRLQNHFSCCHIFSGAPWQVMLCWVSSAIHQPNKGSAGEEGRAIIIIWAKSARSALMIISCLSQNDIFESLTLPPLEFSCLCIQCLIKDENDALQLERILLILSDCTRTSWTEAMSLAGASIVGRYPMTFCETWTLLRTEILNPV